MTTQGAALSLYLTGYLNQKNKPNENYAREFMELFCVGITDATGTPNYTHRALCSRRRDVECAAGPGAEGK